MSVTLSEMEAGGISNSQDRSSQLAATPPPLRQRKGKIIILNIFCSLVATQIKARFENALASFSPRRLVSFFAGK